MRRRLAWLLLAVAAAAVVLSLVIGDLRSEDLAIGIALFAFIGSFAGVGALVASRLPTNPLGWIMLAAGLVVALIVLGDAWGSVLGRWFGSWAWVVPVGSTATLLLLFFPSGRPPSPRWRPVTWAACGALLVGSVGVAFEPGRLEGYDVPNPVGVAGADVLASGGLLTLALTAIASVASVFVRYRSAGFGERQQLKWLLWAAGLVALVVLTIAGAGVAGVELGEDLVNSGMTGSLVALPIAIGIAILRHGLFDIDVVINRTLVYGALTATLVASYLAGVLLLQLALGPLTEDNDLAIAGSTLAAAAIFRPARSRIQALVDRRYYRRKYDAALTIERFGSRLRDQVELDALSRELRDVVGETMQPAHSSLWLRTPG